jgi:hypothetical protein
MNIIAEAPPITALAMQPSATSVLGATYGPSLIGSMPQ